MNVSVNYTSAAPAKTAETGTSQKVTHAAGEKLPLPNKDDAVILNISMEGKKAADSLPHKKPDMNDCIVQLENTHTRLDHLPEYSGILKADQQIADALSGQDDKTKGFVYHTIRQHFLIDNNRSLTEEERQASIALGMKKAEYAAKNMIPEGMRTSFMDAMEQIAKLAASGKADAEGKMDYGTSRGHTFMQPDGTLVQTTDSVDMMKHLDPEAYRNYSDLLDKAGESNRQEDFVDAMRYQLKWHTNTFTKNPNMPADYEKQQNQTVSSALKHHEIDNTFDDIRTGTLEEFLKDIRSFQEKHPGFMNEILGSFEKQMQYFTTHAQ